MNETYKKYLEEKWKEAEKIAIQVGSPGNRTINCFFDKLCQPYYFWKKENEPNESDINEQK